MSISLTVSPPYRFQDTEEEINAKLDARWRSHAATELEEQLDAPYRVLLHNDPVTPMEYVTALIHRVFGIGMLRSFWVMIRAHMTGTAVVVVESRKQAERHVADAHAQARQSGFDCLTFSAEPAEG